jgi:hypothetical protein
MVSWTRSHPYPCRIEVHLFLSCLNETCLECRKFYGERIEMLSNRVLRQLYLTLLSCPDSQNTLMVTLLILSHIVFIPWTESLRCVVAICILAGLPFLTYNQTILEHRDLKMLFCM